MNTHKALIIAGTLILGLLSWYFSDIVTYILIAAVISTLAQPLVSLLTKIKISKSKHLSRTAAAIASLVIIWTFFISAISVLIPMILNEANVLASIDPYSIVTYLSQSLENITSSPAFTRFGLDIDLINKMLLEYINNSVNISILGDMVNGAFGALGTISIMLFAVTFIMFFFLKDSSMFSDLILLLVPDSSEDKWKNVLTSSASLIKRYIIGVGIQIAVILVLDTIGFSIIGLGFEHAIIVALFASIINVIPYIGPWIGAAFGVLIAITTNIGAPFYDVTLPLIIYILIVVGIVQVIDNVILQPLIFSNSVKAHPLEIFFVILMAGSVAGITGMILAIPAYTVIRVIAKEFLSKSKIVRAMTNKL